jgi:hypothetical protein
VCLTSEDVDHSILHATPAGEARAKWQELKVPRRVTLDRSYRRHLVLFRNFRTFYRLRIPKNCLGISRHFRHKVEQGSNYYFSNSAARFLHPLPRTLIIIRGMLNLVRAVSLSSLSSRTQRGLENNPLRTELPSIAGLADFHASCLFSLVPKASSFRSPADLQVSRMRMREKLLPIANYKQAPTYDSRQP